MSFTSTTIDLYGININYAAVVITVGILICYLMSIALYASRYRRVYPVMIFAPIAFVLAVFISRITHWYFNSESYTSFIAAFTEYDVGSFTLPGAMIGIWLGAFICEKLHGCDDRWAVLDAAAPGFILMVVFLRLSSWFTNSCYGRMAIKTKLFQHFPVAIASTDAAGNVSYKFATFMVEAILLFILFLVFTGFYYRHSHDKMHYPCSKNGNTAKMVLIAFNCIELVMDSTRNDSTIMRFKLISYLNQYSAFIHFAMIFAAITALLVLIYYSSKGIKAHGFKWYYILIWLLFLASLFGIGFLGEYKVQRTARYLRCYSIMSVFSLLLFISEYIPYRLCIKESGQEDY